MPIYYESGAQKKSYAVNNDIKKDNKNQTAVSVFTYAVFNFLQL